MREKSRSTVYQLCFVALMAAVMCFMGPLSIPIGEVPVSFTNLIIYLSVYLLGMKMGTASCIVYLLLGMVGLPVFSGYSGGLAKLAGPTGGYLIGFIFMALICGFFMEKSSYKMPWCIAGMILGTIVAYIFGTIWFMILMKCTFQYAMASCVLPFIFGDLAKIVFAELAGRELRKRLRLAGLV